MLPDLASLTNLTNHVRQALGVQQKREIQSAASRLPRVLEGPWGRAEVRRGDDAAAIPDAEGYLLLAAEGMWPELVAREPRFAGYCAVMVNVSDIYAMGGRPLAIVDTLYATDATTAEPLWAGMADAAARFGVPIVGGHTNLHSPYPALSAAILGRARRLLTSFDARPGDDLIVAVDLRGQMHGRYPFWNASTEAPPERLRADYQILPRLAEDEVAAAGKDISMGGVVGTAVMLLESSGVGATLSLDTMPHPPGVPWESWLLTFPSYGFLLSVPPARSGEALTAFAARGIDAAVVGRVDDSHRLTIAAGAERATLWDLNQTPLTGFGPGSQSS